MTTNGFRQRRQPRRASPFTDLGVERFEPTLQSPFNDFVEATLRARRERRQNLSLLPLAEPTQTRFLRGADEPSATSDVLRGLSDIFRGEGRLTENVPQIGQGFRDIAKGFQMDVTDPVGRFAESPVGQALGQALSDPVSGFLGQGTGETLESIPGVNLPTRENPFGDPDSAASQAIERFLESGVADVVTPGAGIATPANIRRFLALGEKVPFLRSLVGETPTSIRKNTVVEGLERVEKASFAERMSIAINPNQLSGSTVAVTTAQATTLANAAVEANSKSPVVTRMIEAMQEIKLQRSIQDFSNTQERSRRAGLGFQAQEEALSAGDELGSSAAFLKGQGAGQFPSATDLNKFAGLFDTAEVTALSDMVRNSGALTSPFEIARTDLALQKLFSLQPTLPTKGELKALDKVFGRQFVKEFASTKQLAIDNGVWAEIAALWNLPRSLLASFDLSATFRQAGALAAGHPDRWAESSAAQISAFRSKGAADIIRELLETHPNYSLYTEASDGSRRLFQAQTGPGAKLADREEVFLSKWIGKIPFIRASERAYVTMLNKFRFDVMDDIVQAKLATGNPITEGELDDIARYVNWGTGRGPMPVPDTMAVVLNGLFFSPRLFTSRIALPFSALSKHPNVRKQIAKDLVASVATGITLTFLWNLAADSGFGGEKGTSNDMHPVETDPRSSDFGKFRLGSTRWDAWGGNQQIARLVWGMATGERKSVSTGSITKRERDAILMDFLRSKLAPATGLLIDFQQGEDLLGQRPFDLSKAGDFTDADNPIIQTLAPLLIQDILQQINEEGIMSGWKATPSALGIGTVTFEGKNDVRQQVVNEMIAEGTLQSLTEFTDINDIIEADPDVVAMVIDQDSRVVSFGEELQEKFVRSNTGSDVFFSSMDNIRTDFKEQADELALEEGPIITDGIVQRSGEGFRKGYGDLVRNRISAMNAIAEANRETVDSLDDGHELQSEFRSALEFYADNIFPPEPPEGERENIFEGIGEDFDVSAQEQKLDFVQKELGGEMFQRVETFLREREHPLRSQLRSDQDALQGYFRVTETAMRLIGGEALVETWRVYLSLSNAEKKNFKAKDELSGGDLTFGLNMAAESKILYRETRDPEIDKLLLKWGYVQGLVHPDAVEQDLDALQLRSLPR